MKGRLVAHWIKLHGWVLADSRSLLVFLQKDWSLLKIVACISIAM